ncbi:hypothetical protein [Microbacterium sp. UBA837]|uniref:hypothetical protein n=1 Tax=Microbacterium sp. UBA837 TaxID=1946956 RepID=UPI0025F29CB9|nr:hypothetical protein [Microbacterium sp. UBA837]|tara:strand:+ start:3987 stop:5228 length:1242 start_codon:yes stop_codon:yes gene_type:complete
MRIRGLGDISTSKLWLTVDIGIVAAGNAVALILAARALTPAALSDFSIVLLVATSAVALQRATILTPGFATQRTSGQGAVPLRWALSVSTPSGVVVGSSMLFIAPGQDPVSLAIASVPLLVLVLVADVARAYLLNLQAAGRAAAADSVLFAAIVALFSFVALSPAAATATTLLLVYDAAVFGGTCLIVAFAVAARRNDERSSISLVATWRLGRWSGADNLLSALASIVPMVVTTSALNAALAGEYRLLQSAIGPLNVLTTSIIASVGIESWRLIDANALRRLHKQVVRMTVGLTLFTLVYIVAAELLIIWASGLSSPSILRVAVVCAIAGLLNSLRTPSQAAALALGGQRYGFVIRVFVVIAAAALTFLGGWTSLLPWDDPIGWIAIVSSLANLVGWRIAYARSAREASSEIT